MLTLSLCCHIYLSATSIFQLIGRNNQCIQRHKVLKITLSNHGKRNKNRMLKPQYKHLMQGQTYKKYENFVVAGAWSDLAGFLVQLKVENKCRVTNIYSSLCSGAYSLKKKRVVVGGQVLISLLSIKFHFFLELQIDWWILRCCLSIKSAMFAHKSHYAGFLLGVFANPSCYFGYDQVTQILCTVPHDVQPSDCIK